MINANGNAQFIDAVTIIESPAPIIGVVFVVDSIVVGFGLSTCAVLCDLNTSAKEEIDRGMFEWVKLIIHALFRHSTPQASVYHIFLEGFVIEF